MWLDYMRYEQRYSHGQLLGSLVHEVTIRLDGLGGLVDSLPVSLEKAGDSREAAERSKWLAEAKETVADLAQVKVELGELVDAYSRVVRGDLEPVNVNAVARKVRRQLKKTADEAQAEIEIHLELQSDVPPARSVQSRLEQIVMNLVLNAIQQIAKL